MYATLFDLPAGQVYTITTGAFRCHGCGRTATNITYLALATDRYDFVHGARRRWFAFHNPVCACSEGIWLEDGRVAQSSRA